MRIHQPSLHQAAAGLRPVGQLCHITSPFLPRICSRTLLGVLRPSYQRRSRCSGLLRSASADVRTSDDVIAFGGPVYPVIELHLSDEKCENNQTGWCAEKYYRFLANSTLRARTIDAAVLACTLNGYSGYVNRKTLPTENLLEDTDGLLRVLSGAVAGCDRFLLTCSSSDDVIAF